MQDFVHQPYALRFQLRSLKGGRFRSPGLEVSRLWGLIHVQFWVRSLGFRSLGFRGLGV